MEQQKISEFLQQKTKQLGKIKNPMQREAMQNFNIILVDLEGYFQHQQSNLITKQTLRAYLVKKFMVSEVTAKRYENQLVLNDVIIWDETLKAFKLPDGIVVPVDAENGQ